MSFLHGFGIFVLCLAGAAVWSLAYISLSEYLEDWMTSKSAAFIALLVLGIIPGLALVIFF